MKKYGRRFFTLLMLSLLWLPASAAQAAMLHGVIVEENDGPIGRITWTILNEDGFVPVREGKGQQIRTSLNPGRYIISVDGDTQGRESIEMGASHQFIRILTRRFY
ncbi:MAG: hypothetical protein R3E95_08225 [Thiolinea sp.]